MESLRKLVPPAYMLLALLAMVALHRFLPIVQLLQRPYTYAGVVFIVAGVLIAATSARLFSRMGTPVVPFQRSTVLVTAGMYRYTRNPMYLGLTLILIGAWIAFGSLGPGLVLPVFLWIIQQSFIRGEERFLEEIFGEQYLSYKRRVRRWI